MQDIGRTGSAVPCPSRSRDRRARGGLLLAALLLSALTTLSAQAGTVGEQIEALLKDPERPAAPEFTGISAWVNSEGPLTMAALRGKVVLLDFWTYG